MRLPLDVERQVTAGEDRYRDRLPTHDEVGIPRIASRDWRTSPRQARNVRPRVVGIDRIRVQKEL